MTDTPLDAEAPDVQLLWAARAGDAGSLGLLLARHRAGMHAVAGILLGYGPDAEDAVQEVSIVALRRIGDITGPGRRGAVAAHSGAQCLPGHAAPHVGGSFGDRRARPAGAVHRA